MRNAMNGSPLALIAAAGIASSSLAGVTWDIGNAGNSVDYTFGSEDTVFAFGSAAMGLVTASMDSDSIAVSAVSDAGFSASAVVATESGVYVNAGRFFSVAGTTAFAVSGSSWQEVAWRIYDHVNLDQTGNPTVIFEAYADSGASLSDSFTLGTGVYAVELISFATSSDGTVNAFANFTIVPAPGAIALLGAAGLVGGRRRRG